MPLVRALPSEKAHRVRPGRLRIAAAAGLVLMMLAGCGAGQEGDPIIVGQPATTVPTTTVQVAPAAPVDILGEWEVVEVVLDGAVSPRPDDRPYVVLVEVGGLTGDAGCNRFFGEWAYLPDGRLEVRDLAMTEMACMGRDDWFDLLDALGRTSLIGADGENRTLSSPDGTTVVRLVPVADDDVPIVAESNGASGADVADYIGLDLDAAGALADRDARPWRVVREDGEALAVTQDFNPDRVNFEVEAGIVVGVSLG